MTFINEDKLKLAGLSVVLQPTSRTSAIPLTNWLSELEYPPVWIPLPRQNGVNKVMAVLSNSDNYAALVQHIFQQISYRTAVEWEGKQYELTGVEVDNNELHVLEIAIFASSPLPPTLGRAIHAQCFHWLGSADPALAEKLHNCETFPISLAIKPGPSRNQMYLRIGLLQRELLAPLLWGMSQDVGGEVLFTGIPCRLGKWIEIKRSNNFEALAQVPAQKTIELEFLSPTSFKQQGQTIQTFPLAELVFSSLFRRWNAFAPTELQFDPISWQCCTSAYELKTVALKMKAKAEIGAKGWARYEFANDEQAQIATTLAHFAAFAGVGRKTGMGMGQTRIVSSDS